MVQVQANGVKNEKPENKIIDDGAFPKDWSLEEIAKAAHPSAVPGATHVLAWKCIEDDRPWRVEDCLVVCRLNEVDWYLANVARNLGIKGREKWELVMVHMGPGYKGDPFGRWVMHIERYDKRPSNKDIYDFMDEHYWRLGAENGSKLVGGAVCKTTWEAVVKEKPTRDFKK